MNIDCYRQILGQCFPHLPISSIEFIGGGSYRVFEAKTAALPTTRLIFRFPHSDDADDLLRREQHVCHLLGPLLPFPIPRYEYWTEGCALFEHPVGGYPRLEGAPLQACRLDPPGLRHTAAQLGLLLSALHNVPLKVAQEAGIPAFSHSRSRDAQRALYAEIQLHAFPRLDSQEPAWTRSLFEPYLAEEANWEFAPVLVHGDFDSSNILYSPDQGQVVGIIDFEGANLGDPAWDFCALNAEYGTDFLQLLLLSYRLPLDTGLTERATFHSRRILFHELLYGILQDAPAFFNHGRVRLRRAMAGVEPIGDWLAASTSETRQQEGHPN